MAAIPGTPEYQPTTVQKVKGEIFKRAPHYIGRAIQLLMYGIFQAWQFILQVIKDAFEH
jgi:hypothetical protein